MRLGLTVLLCLLNTGCALWRADREEPVETRARAEKAQPELRPSDVLKPESQQIASPVTDRFYMRGIYFQPSVATEVRLDASDGSAGTLISAEDDLGLDDTLNQGRMEVDMRMANDHHLRLDFFKANRFHQQPLPRDIEFGDFTFTEGTEFRSKFDWRTFSITYMYAPLHTERLEAGILHGFHIVQVKAEGGEPGTLNREEAAEVGIYPTIGLGGTVRLSRRFSFTARAQVLFLEWEDEFTARMADYHADLQFRWHKNLAIGLGYTNLKNEIELFEISQPLLFNMNTSGPELFFRASF